MHLRHLDAKVQEQDEMLLQRQLDWERQLRDTRADAQTAQLHETENAKELQQCKRRLRESQDKAKVLAQKLREQACPSATQSLHL